MLTWCNNVIHWSFLSSTCFGRIRPSSVVQDVKLQHMVFGTLKNEGTWSVCIVATITSSVPDNGLMRPKNVELRKLQWIILLHQVGISLYFMMKIVVISSHSFGKTYRCHHQGSRIKNLMDSRWDLTRRLKG